VQNKLAAFKLILRGFDLNRLRLGELSAVRISCQYEAIDRLIRENLLLVLEVWRVSVIAVTFHGLTIPSRR